MPRDFSTDGAFGAGDNVSGGAIPDGTSTGSNIVSDSGMNGAGTPTSTHSYMEQGPGGSPVAITAANQYGYWGGDAGAPMGGGVYNTTGVGSGGPGKNAFGFDIGSAITPDQAAQYHIRSNLSREQLNGADPGAALGMMFADGGEVPGDDGGASNNISDLLSLALSSVDQGLDYGRKKHGLLQGGQQQAGLRTPMIPGNQSESGIPRPQPMPGPLPPTNNPFGQRRQFGQNDQEDQEQATAQAVAIPDDEEGTS